MKKILMILLGVSSVHVNSLAKPFSQIIAEKKQFNDAQLAELKDKVSQLDWSALMNLLAHYPLNEEMKDTLLRVRYDLETKALQEAINHPQKLSTGQLMSLVERLDQLSKEQVDMLWKVLINKIKSIPTDNILSDAEIQKLLHLGEKVDAFKRSAYEPNDDEDLEEIVNKAYAPLTDKWNKMLANPINPNPMNQARIYNIPPQNLNIFQQEKKPLAYPSFENDLPGNKENLKPVAQNLYPSLPRTLAEHSANLSEDLISNQANPNPMKQARIYNIPPQNPNIVPPEKKQLAYPSFENDLPGNKENLKPVAQNLYPSLPRTLAEHSANLSAGITEPYPVTYPSFDNK